MTQASLPQDALLATIKAQLSDDTAETASLQASLSALLNLYEKQGRQINRLTKLSDNTEAKLTNANEALGSLTRNLSRFVPDAVVETLLADGAEQLPTNSRQKITVFFSDVVGFTGITERLDPERLAALVTDYFTEMAEICAKWGGTLDQFIGDAIVIFFGAPQSRGVEEDAIRAVSMALDMQARLQSLRHKWESEGLNQPFHVRMGLATGHCNVGNFGSHERLHYTAMGTAVNTAARIQSLAPADGIFIAEESYMLVRDHIKCTFEQTTTLSGQNHPTTLYRLADDQEGWQSQILSANTKGYRLYFDPSIVEDTTELKALLQSALDTLGQN